jgi:hypothetical protein
VIRSTLHQLCSRNLHRRWASSTTASARGKDRSMLAKEPPNAVVCTTAVAPSAWHTAAISRNLLCPALTSLQSSPNPSTVHHLAIIRSVYRTTDLEPLASLTVSSLSLRSSSLFGLEPSGQPPENDTIFLQPSTTFPIHSSTPLA